MANVVVLPKMGVTMVSGMVSSWLKAEGDYVKEGETLFEVETDKVTQDVESDCSGYLRKILVPEYVRVPITTPIAVITADEQEDIAPLLLELEKKEEAAEAEEETAPVQTAVKKEKAARIAASPRAKKLAQENGIDLADIPSTGARISEDDVKKYLETLAAKNDGENIPYTGKRRFIGEKLLHSATSKPHIYDMLTVDMTAVMTRRAADKKAGRKPFSTADYLIMACAHALANNPIINSTMVGETITQHRNINIGYAVATPDGLIVPVIHHMQDKQIEEVSAERAALVEKALHGGLSTDDVTDGTFTISNLGTMGVKFLTAIVNEPEVSILAVGCIEKRPVVDEDDQIAVRYCMDITLCSDHRVVDGYQAANTLCDIKKYLESVK